MEGRDVHESLDAQEGAADAAATTSPAVEDTTRARHVTWADPVAALQRAVGMSREEMLTALRSGELPKPPIGELLGFDLLEVESGRAVFGFRPREYHCNPVGGVAAGVAATVLDAAMWLAVQTSVPERTIASTVNLSLHFVASLSADAGDVRAEARAVHVGRRTGTAQARLVDESGKLYSHATAGFHCTSFDSGR
jgi:uncharacterized protein (TIGR00369 family)